MAKPPSSLRLARLFHGEIISCDSVAVYRDFEIGTAKPTPAERRELPHHLIDAVSPDQGYSAGDYSRDARLAIAQVVSRRPSPYRHGRNRALSAGIGRRSLRWPTAAPMLCVTVCEILRPRKGPGRLHRILQRIDTAAAAAIHPNDTPKLIRAIEVPLTAGQPITQAWNAASSSQPPHRLPHSAHRPRPRPSTALRAHQHPAPRPCLPRGWSKKRAC